MGKSAHPNKNGSVKEMGKPLIETLTPEPGEEKLKTPDFIPQETLQETIDFQMEFNKAKEELGEIKRQLFLSQAKLKQAKEEACLDEIQTVLDKRNCILRPLPNDLFEVIWKG